MRCSGKPLSSASSFVDGSRFSFCDELPARAHHPAHLLGDVDGEADRAALVGQRARDRLADPPRRVGRKLVAHPVVELLDRADQAEVALLDQVEQRHAGPRVVPRDRHHEAQVRLDQLPLRVLVACVLAPGELALFLARQQRPVADLADVEPQRVAGRRLRDRSGLLVVVGRLVRPARRSRAFASSAGSGSR